MIYPSSTPKKAAGLSRDQLKATLIEKFGTVKKAAELISEKPKLVGDTIARHVRNERIRIKLSTIIGKSYKATWGEKPNGKTEENDGPAARLPRRRRVASGQSV